MGRFAAVLAVLFLAGSAWGQEEKKQEDKQAEKEAEAKAKERIKQLQDASKKCKSVDDFINALDGVGDDPHPLILSELKKWLGRPQPELQQEAADEIGKFKNDEKAAQALISHARAVRVPDVAIKCLKEVGDIGAKKTAKDLHGFFTHKEKDVAKEAIDSCGSVKSKDSIEPLMNLAEELERDKERNSQQQQGGGMSGGQMPGPQVPGGGGSQQNQDEEKKKRAEDLLPRAIQSLKDITGEKYNTTKEWRKWWSKNKNFFKDGSEEKKEEKK